MSYVTLKVSIKNPFYDSCVDVLNNKGKVIGLIPCSQIIKKTNLSEGFVYELTIPPDYVEEVYND